MKLTVTGIFIHENSRSHSNRLSVLKNVENPAGIC